MFNWCANQDASQVKPAIRPVPSIFDWVTKAVLIAMISGGTLPCKKRIDHHLDQCIGQQQGAAM